MPITLGSNIASLGAQRRLTEASDSLSRTFERLSTGLRINSAGDDPAGMALAASLNVSARVLGAAMRNVNDGISVVNIVDAALQQMSTILDRQSELAQQAANGVYSATQRAALDNEAQALVAEYYRIIGSTEFNGMKLLDGSVTEIALQVDESSTLTFELPSGATVTTQSGTGTFTYTSTFDAVWANLEMVSADFNGDGNLDIAAGGTIGNTYVFRGKGDGTFWAPYVIAGYGDQMNAVDVNGDGRTDLVVATATAAGSVKVSLNSGGTLGAFVTYTTGMSNNSTAALADFNNDGKLDVVTSGSSGTNGIRIALGNGNGSFNAPGATYLSAVANGGGRHISAADVNGDGNADVLAEGQLYLGNGNGTFLFGTNMTIGVALEDINGDGALDLVSHSGGTLSVRLNNGAGGFGGTISTNTGGAGTPYHSSFADINADGNLDVVIPPWYGGSGIVLLGNGNGTFKVASTFNVGSNVGGLVLGDFNGDGAYDFVTNNASNLDLYHYQGNYVTTTTNPPLDIDLTTAESARTALTTLESFRTALIADRSEVGAFRSRLDVVHSVVSARQEALRGAAARITDVDVAEETANLVRAQILQQVSSAMFAQANQQSNLVLQLLQA